MLDAAARVEPRNISMYPSDWRIVDDSDTGDAGTSAALRRIVREWKKFQECPALSGPNEHVTLVTDGVTVAT